MACERCKELEGIIKELQRHDRLKYQEIRAAIDAADKALKWWTDNMTKQILRTTEMKQRGEFLK